MGLLMFGPLTEYLDMPASEKDRTGLRRWTTMLLKGGTGVQKRIICGYNPCQSNRQDNSTSYSQQRRYQIWQHQDHITCPRAKFREDLGKLLKEWRAAGDRLIVCLDANKNIYTQALWKLLTNLEGLRMIEVVGRYTGKKIGPTYFQGQLLIDGIWTTPDVTVSNACIMPAGYGIGDHRLFIIDLHTASLVGFRSAKRAPCSIRTTQHAPPTCGEKIHQESGRKSTAAPINRKIGRSPLWQHR
jgi:hypothetical protein